jgi:hypothetical protein
MLALNQTGILQNPSSGFPYPPCMAIWVNRPWMQFWLGFGSDYLEPEPNRTFHLPH